MGGLAGHVALGLFFLLIGLWHLHNHSTHRHSGLPWFPTSFLRHLELYLIMLGCSVFAFSEVRHPPFDHNGSFLSARLHNLEHASMAAAFYTYALFALVLDKTRPRAHEDLVFLPAAVAFAQELLLFHFHSTDHAGVEGRYHYLLQLVIIVSLTTTLMGVGSVGRQSFFVSYVRSLSIVFQGLWLVVMGVMLWTPEFFPRGCFVREENGRDVVRCQDQGSLDRAKALVNIGFGWLLIGVVVLGVCFHLVADRVHGGGKEGISDDRQGFLQLHVEKGFRPVDTVEE
ncbi:hypothetical protein Nepgr_009757 [Nepenthes gracilis]|uniref:Transmembrane protein 45B n=1 Tax=Nepenthes gracilis TaxID=150966 RepID=A0AAD3XKF9_NEPGR|nr:hypothetical protein Nepgr_009757 [Nepenthes gracilis]